ncbi:DNA sulfur modification protein DndB [Devosia sp.]|uniref:DNA sulfur modification protein DndB n=1 Tax=Devosia sp. TaxID=1871048 RepID=UPI0025BE8468|nr:DNA sulfur modification protein DndB [Devosia sp.]
MRGVQAGREYYISMCPLGLVPKIFVFNETGLTAQQRSQRQLNRGRIPQITKYLVENKTDYVFSAITASIDGEAVFMPNASDDLTGTLRVQMKHAKLIINDGQHRRAAIEAAIEQVPELADETIAVVLFYDRGLARCQQMFADLNRHAVRPSKSLGVLYDHRDGLAMMSKLLLSRVPGLSELIEFEKTSLSPRSKPLFTLSAFYTATEALLSDLDMEESEREANAGDFWEAVALHMPHWSEVTSGAMTSGSLRDTYINSHSVVLHALGKVGNTMLRSSTIANPNAAMEGLTMIDWRKSSPLWDGRCVIAGKMSKAHHSVLLTANAIKQQLGMPLSAGEHSLELGFKGISNAA